MREFEMEGDKWNDLHGSYRTQQNGMGHNDCFRTNERWKYPILRRLPHVERIDDQAFVPYT